MPWGINQIELIGLTILGVIVKRDTLRFDGNTPLPLDIHRIENLSRHLSLGQPTTRLDEAIGERGLAMIDVRDDGEITDVFLIGHETQSLSLSARN